MAGIANFTSLNVTNATNATTTVGPAAVIITGVSNAASGADKTLWLGGRIAQIAIVFLIVGLCFAFRKPIQALLKPLPAKCGECCRMRNIKRCWIRCLSKLCFCCPCNEGSSGFQTLLEAHDVLTVTLVGADELKKAMNFYVEVWTEPQEAASRISRTQLEAKANTSFSLGLEKLELDWYGDEENVIIQVVEFPAAGKERPLGDIVLKGKKVCEYAQEAKQSPSNMQAGTRRFAIPRMSMDRQRLRKKKLKDAEPGNIVMSYVLSKVQDRVAFGTGMGVTDHQEAELKRENEELQKEVSNLRTQLSRTGSAGSLGSLDSAGQPKKLESVMSLVIRFEISSRRAATGHVDIMQYKPYESDAA